MAELKGFADLVKLAMKERPKKPKNVEDIWDKFLSVALMGNKRSESDIRFLRTMLKTQLEYDYVRKTDGDDWRDAVEEVLKTRMSRIKDDDTLTMLSNLKAEIFRISASLKGAARFFEKNEMSNKFLEETLSTREKSMEFIENLVEDQDVPNIRYTKIIIWLHSLGFAFDFAPPTWQTKKFVNEEFEYYRFYDDDKYFMTKVEEYADKIKVKGKTVRDVAVAIFYYITLKSMLPPRSQEKKKFSPAIMIKFLKSKKLALEKLSDLLADDEEREKFMEDQYNFVNSK